MSIAFLLCMAAALGWVAMTRVAYSASGLTSPALALMTMTVVLFGFGVSGALPLGAQLVVWLGVTFAVLAVGHYVYARRWQGGRNTKCWLFALPFAVFILAIPSWYQFVMWDEFSFWASSVKYMLAADTLYDAQSPVLFKWYPPGQQLLQYAVVRFAGWSEHALVYTQIIFMLACLLGLVGAFWARCSWPGLAVFWACCALVYVFGFNFSTVLVDPLLAVAFAFSMGLGIKARNAWHYAVSFSLSLAMLVLIKHVGLIFALIAYGLFLMSMLFDRPGVAKAGVLWSGRKQWVLWGARAALPGVVLLSVKFSWDYFVAANGAVSSQALPPLVDFFDPVFMDRFWLTWAAFSAALAKSSFVAKVIVLAGLGAWCIYWAQSECRLQAALQVSWMLLGLAGYLAFLLFSYLVFFSEFEGVRLASFGRYSKTGLLALTLVLFVWATARAQSLQRRRRTIFTVIFLLLGFVVSKDLRVNLFGEERNEKAIAVRAEVKVLSDQVKPLLQPGDAVYFIDQHSVGYETHVFAYEVLPFGSSKACWSMGQRYGEHDIYTCNARLADVLRGYQYLALLNADRQFYEHAGTLLPVDIGQPKSGVFKVDHRNGEVIALTPVSTINRDPDTDAN